MKKILNRSKEENKKLSSIVLLVAALLFVTVSLLVKDNSAKEKAEEYVEYERGKVVQILSDSSTKDPVADNAYRGEQYMIVEVKSGQYKGQQMVAYNYVGPVYSQPVKQNSNVILLISTYSNGDHNATVYEYNRLVPLIVLLLMFIGASFAVGGRSAGKSLLSLALTFCTLFLILIPALLKGAPMLPTIFAACAFLTIVSLIIMDGISIKSYSAAFGAISGTAIALLFGLLAQVLCHIDGLRAENAEALLQLRQTGESLIGLKGLLVGGVIISSLGAVLDVTMGIASSLYQVHVANEQFTFSQLFKAGLDIGKDMVSTMTNTLILAFLGSDFTLVIYLYSLGLSFHQLISSSYLSLEVISSLSCSIGVILSIPITALICARNYSKN